MFEPEKFATPAAKPLPVVLLLDVSTSMSGEKIEQLNGAVGDMLNNFAQDDLMDCEIQVSIITFGKQANLELPYTKASKVKWDGLQANGSTPMGHALILAKEMIEDKNKTPSRAYIPAIVLVSDGQPTDDWEEPLSDFISNGRSSKCERFAMAIGNDADEQVLNRFIEGTTNELFYAEDALQIHEFFRFITMSVSMRGKSTNPNILTNQSFREDTNSSLPENYTEKSKDNSEKINKDTKETEKQQESKTITDDDDYW